MKEIIIKSKLIIMMAMFSLSHANDSEDNALIFFYLSDCGFCHQQADDIKTTMSQHNINLNIQGISLNAVPLEGFDYPWSPDYGQAEQFNVMVVPTSVFFNQKNQQYIIIEGYQPLLESLKHIGWINQ